MPHDHAPHDGQEWDAAYTANGDGVPLWSGRPNGALVAEVSELTPGSALEVGCGEGADAVWLARQGWRVTAVDPSGVALARAAAAAEAADVEVTWVHGDVLAMPGGTGRHDLVCAHYVPLRHADGDVIGALLGAVAPGGTLLFVHHDGLEEHFREHGKDPADFVSVRDVVARLGDEWVIEVNEVRPRPAPLPEGATHTHDELVRARLRRT